MKNPEIERSEFTIIEYNLAKEMFLYLKTLIERVNVNLVHLEITKKRIKSDIKYHNKHHKDLLKSKYSTDSEKKKFKESKKDFIEGSRSRVKILNRYKKKFLAQKSKWTADKIKCQKRYEEISNKLWPVNNS